MDTIEPGNTFKKRFLQTRNPVFWLTVVTAALLVLGIGLSVRVYGELRTQSDSPRLVKRSAIQTERELLRLHGLIQADQATRDLVGIERQVQLITSYLSDVRDETEPTPAGAAVEARLTFVEEDWTSLRSDLDRWLSQPANDALRADLSQEIIRLAAATEDLADQYDAMDAAQAAQLSQASRNLLALLVGFMLIFLLFLGMTGWYTYRLIWEREQALALHMAEQRERWRQGNALRRLYNVTSTPSLDFTEKASAMLNIGCQLFALPLGVLARADGEHFSVAAVNTPERRFSIQSIPGLTDAQFLESFAGLEMVTIQPIDANLQRAHPVYKRWRLEACMGVPVAVAGQPFGTLFFAGSATAAANITETDRETLKLMAQWIATELARQQAGAALHRSEAEFRQLFEYAPIGMVVSALDGHILNVNEAFCRMVGYTAAELQGRRFVDITHADDIATKVAFGQALLAGTRRSFQMENRYISRDGQVVATLLQTTLREDNQGRPQDFIGQMVDITERKRAEEALWQAQKLESIGLLAGGIAHDFNNLLTIILAQNELAIQQIPPAAPAQTHLQKSQVAAERAADLTRQLLAYAGRSDLRPQHISLNEVVIGSHDLFQTILAQVPLMLSLAPDSPTFAADRSQVQQVIMNLLLNAAQAVAGTDGAIRLSTYVYELESVGDGQRLVGGEALAPGQYACLEVSDDGIGMSPATQARIFDPFYTTKATGHGLGLSATLGIVRSHRGGLLVESEPEVGTTFRVLFPTSALTQATAPEEGAVYSRKTCVLIVDDEEPIREAVRDILSMVDIESLVAATGPEAIACYKENHQNIDLVLLDVQMPEMAGDAVLEALRNINDRVPVVFASGYRGPEIAEQLVKHDRVSFLQKPFAVNALLTEVRSKLN